MGGVDGGVFIDKEGEESSRRIFFLFFNFTKTFATDLPGAPPPPPSPQPPQPSEFQVNFSPSV
jgi:hypothetical protein